MMADGQLGTFVREFIECVVNSHDLNTIDRAVNEMVSPEVAWRHGAGRRGPSGVLPSAGHSAPGLAHRRSGDPGGGRVRRDSCLGRGKLAFDQDGVPWQPGYPIAVEWLTVTRIVDGKAVEGRLVTWLVTARA